MQAGSTAAVFPKRAPHVRFAGACAAALLGVVATVGCSASRGPSPLPADRSAAATAAATTTTAAVTAAAERNISPAGNCDRPIRRAPLEVVLNRTTRLQTNGRGETIVPTFSSRDDALAAGLDVLHRSIARFVDEQLSKPCKDGCSDRLIACRPTRNDDSLIGVFCQRRWEQGASAGPGRKSFLWRRTHNGIEPLNLEDPPVSWCGSPNPVAAPGGLAFATPSQPAPAGSPSRRDSLVVVAYNQAHDAAAKHINQWIADFEKSAERSVDLDAMQQCDVVASTHDFFGVSCRASGSRSHPHGALSSSIARSINISLRNNTTITLDHVFAGREAARQRASAQCLAEARRFGQRLGGGAFDLKLGRHSDYELGPRGVTITADYHYPSGRETVVGKHSCFVSYADIGTSFDEIVAAVQ